jgi:hypothetical protein
MPLFANKSSLITGKQIQQTHRFVLNIKGVDAALIQDVTPPSYKTEIQTFQMLEYKFVYPTKVDWSNEITFNIIQILDEDLITSTLGFFMQKLYNSSYYASPLGIGNGERDPLLPNELYNARSRVSDFLNNGKNTGYTRNANEGTVLDYSKQKLTSALGRVEIKMLDEEGKVYESWKLNNAFISGITPDNLSYNSETVSKISIKVAYDWADYGYRGVYAEEDVVSRIFGI